MTELFKRFSGFRDTQIDSWDALQTKLPERRRDVLRAIYQTGDFGISTQAISDFLEWPINCVSGRVTELVSAGLVKDSGRRTVNPSGKKAILWVAITNEAAA